MAQSSPVPLQIQPGVIKNGTPASTPGRWYDAHMVRWVGGVMRPVKGWERLALSDAVESPIRATHTWIGNDEVIRTALLCETNAYVLEGDDLIDITPSGGIDGPADDLLAGGYGDDDYNFGTYGTVRPDRERVKPVGPAWSIDNYGQNLLFMSSIDGHLFQWAPDDPPGTLATAVTGAPLNNRCFVVTPERHVILFGIGGQQNSFGWCDREDIEDWDFTDVTNTAGSYDIEPASPIIAATATRYGTIFFTAKQVFFIRYVGLPYVYSYDPIGENAAPLSHAGVVKFADNVIWPSDDTFWLFDGNGMRPIQCDLLDWFKELQDKDFVRFRFAGTAVGSASEVWWFFPESGEEENNRVLIYNFKDEWWSHGVLSRTCGNSSSYITYPIMSDGTDLFQHEKGNYYADGGLPYAELSSINVANGGGKLVSITQMVLDSENPANSMYITVKGRIPRIDPGTPVEVTTGPLTVRGDGYVDARITGRDLKIRVESASNGVAPWTHGKSVIYISPRGGR